MRIISGLIICILLLASCQSKSSKSDETDLTPMTITMDVKGMTCNGCVATVEASVTQLGDGINSVDVNLEKANAVIEYVPAEIDSVEIRKAIELNGYKVLKTAKAE